MMPKSPTRSHAHSATKMHRAAWERANPRVRQIISLMMPLPKDQRRGYEPNLRARVSVAGAVVLEHRLVLAAATRVAEMMDPWQLPGESARKPCKQSNFASRSPWARWLKPVTFSADSPRAA